jgi:hypothetical protein
VLPSFLGTSCFISLWPSSIVTFLSSCPLFVSSIRLHASSATLCALFPVSTQFLSTISAYLLLLKTKPFQPLPVLQVFFPSTTAVKVLPSAALQPF